MTAALVGLTALVAALIQATSGLGFALVLSPVMFAVLSPAGAIVAVTALGLELNLLVLLAERRRPVVPWREIGLVVLAAAPGTACGVLLLRALPKSVLQLGVGLGVIAVTLIRARGRPPAAGASGRRPAAGSDSAVAQLGLGFATGALTTSAGVSGPPLALWLSGRGMSPGQIRDCLSAMFLIIGAFAALALAPVLGRAHLDSTVVKVGIVCVVGGHALGSRAFARLGAHRFEPLLLGVILAAGTVSAVAGAAGL